MPPQIGRQCAAPWELYAKDRIVILSPDAETVLEDVDSDTVRQNRDLLMTSTLTWTYAALRCS